MKFLIALAVILSLLGLTLGQSASASVTGEVSLQGLSFQTNGNISVTDNTFSFRKVTFAEALNVVFYESLSASGSGSSSGSSGSGSASADGIVGVTSFPYSVFGVPVSAFPPTSWLAYFEADISGQYTSASASVDFSASASFAAKVFSSITEIDSSGKVAAWIPLSTRTWTTSSTQTDSTGYLSYVTYTSNNNNWWVNITVAVSAITGRMSVGGAIITPRSIESYIEIGGYPYASTSNHLVLNIYTAALTASGSASVSGQTVTSGSGLSEVYFHFDQSAMISGTKTGVTVSGLGNANIQASDLGNNDLTTSINSATSGSLKATFGNVTISFPAGASSITYDPTYGFAPPNGINSGSFLAPSFLLALLSLLFFVVKF